MLRVCYTIKAKAKEQDKDMNKERLIKFPKVA